MEPDSKQPEPTTEPPKGPAPAEPTPQPKDSVAPTPIEAVSQPNSTTPAEPPKKASVGKIIFVIIAIIVLVIGGILISTFLLAPNLFKATAPAQEINK